MDNQLSLYFDDMFLKDALKTAEWYLKALSTSALPNVVTSLFELFLEDWTQVSINTTKFNKGEFSVTPYSHEKGTVSHTLLIQVNGGRQLFLYTELLSLHLVVHSFNKCLLRAYHAKSFIFTILMQIFLKYFISFPAFYTKNAEHNLTFSLNEKTQPYCGTKP